MELKFFNKQLRRDEALNFFANLPLCLISLEACGGSHYWARELGKLGHDARLIPPGQVKPFVINNKTDVADAIGIVRGRSAPCITPCPGQDC